MKKRIPSLMFPLVHALPEASPVPHAASAPSATTSESSKGIKEMDGGGEVERADSRTDKKAESEKETFSNEPKYAAVDVNTADTSAFIALPGIGNKLALRIVNFRDKLCGFYSIDQIGETYGLPDSVFRKIKPFLRFETNLVKKFNINTATKEEMKSHPYLKWNLANAIVEYRNQHGAFSSLEDLKKISLITTDIFDKVKFYLAL